MQCIDNYDENGVPGLVTAVAALALALEQNGVLGRDAYCGALRRLWDAMPDDEAVGESGAVIERMLGLLGDAGETGSRDDASLPAAAKRQDAILRVA